MSEPTPPPPGWYPDPWNPGGVRWWDGLQWGAPAAPPPGYHQAQGFPDLDDEKRKGDWARTALLWGVGAYAATVVGNLLTLGSFRQTMDELLTQPRRGTAAPVMPLDGPGLVGSVLGNIGSLAAMGVAVVFLVWFHRALVNAQALGLPQRRSPGWGVAGFIIPIVNYWFPYQSACDLFAPGDPARSLVGRWWAMWIGASVATLGMVASALVGSSPVSFAFGVVVLVAYTMAAVAGREMVTLAHDAHVALARDRGLPSAPTGGAPGAPGGPRVPGGPGVPDVPGVSPAPPPAPPKDPWASEPPDPWGRP